MLHVAFVDPSIGDQITGSENCPSGLYWRTLSFRISVAPPCCNTIHLKKKQQQQHSKSTKHTPVAAQRINCESLSWRLQTGCRRLWHTVWCLMPLRCWTDATTRRGDNNFRCITVTNLGKTPNFLGARRGVAACLPSHWEAGGKAGASISVFIREISQGSISIPPSSRVVGGAAWTRGGRTCPPPTPSRLHKSARATVITQRWIISWKLKASQVAAPQTHKLVVISRCTKKKNKVTLKSSLNELMRESAHQMA